MKFSVLKTPKASGRAREACCHRPILTLCDVTAQTIAVSVASQLQVAPVCERVCLQGTAIDIQG